MKAASSLGPGVGLLKEMASRADADPRDLGEDQLSLLRKVFEDPDFGLYLFSIYICGCDKLTENLHLPICQFISHWGESVLEDGSVVTHPPNPEAGEQVTQSFRRLMVRIPRGHYKTTLCTRANALWVLARDPNHDATIGIFNETENNPKSWIQAILDVVESNLLFQRIWRDMIPKGISYWDKEKGVTKDRNWKWGAQGALFVRNSIGIPELSLEPHGISGTAVGRHYSHMILDDIIGRNAANSTAVMEAAINWVDNCRPLENPPERGCQLVAHTPWAYMDCYAHALRQWPNDYVVYARSILEDPETGEPDAAEGKAICPSIISTEQAKKLLQTDFFTNSAQYMCQPKAGRQQDFDEEWLRWGQVVQVGEEPVFVIEAESYDPNLVDLDCEEDRAPKFVPLSWMSKAVILDPAPSKPNEIRAEPRAGNGIVVVGKDPWGRRFLLDCALLRVTEVEVLHKIMDLCETWGVSLVGIEEVNFSAVYAGLFDYIIRREYSFRPDFVACYTRGREKHSRIKQLLRSPLENGFWYVNRTGTARAVQEVLEYPNSETLDLIDSMAYTDEVVQRPDTPTERVFTRYNKRVLEEERGMTGYGDFMGESTSRPGFGGY